MLYRNFAPVAILSLFVSACSTSVDPTNPYDPDAPESIQAKGEVDGVVSLEGSTDPSGVTVALQGVSGTAQTDTSGKFSIKDVRAGTYVLALSKEGYKDLKVQGVAVPLGQKVDVGSLAISIGRGLVRGEVSLTGSSDNGGATVTLQPAAKAESTVKALAAVTAGTTSYAAVSGIDGRWEVDNIPVGWYYLLVSKDGYETTCSDLVNIVKDGDEKTGYSIDMVATSALISFADSSGNHLQPYPSGNGVMYYTGSKTLKAIFNASGVTQYRTAWSEGGLDTAEWEPFAVQKDIAMDSGAQDGEKAFWVEMKDQCQLTRKRSQGLVLDTEPPNVAELSVDGVKGPEGATYLKSPAGQATVRLHAEDATSGVDGYRLSVDKPLTDEPFTAIPATASIVTGLGTADRQYVLYAEYKDRAGNKAAAPVLNARLDNQGPTGTIAVVGIHQEVGGDWFTSSQMDLAITGADPAGTDQTPGSGVTKMKVWNDGETEPDNWVDVAQAVRWSVSPSDGPKGIRLKLQDAVGNPAANEITTSFTLYSTGPVSGVAQVEGGADSSGVLVSVSGFATTALSNPDGTFLINDVPQGIRDVTFTKASYKTVVLRSMEIKAKVGTDLGTVPVLKARGTVYGKAKLEDNSNSSGIVIALSPGNYAGYTDPDGNYRIDNVPVGTYTLTASKENYATQTISEPVVVTEDVQTQVNVPNLQKISSEFTIQDESAGNPHNTTYTKSLAVKLVVTPPAGYAGVCIAEASKYATTCVPENMSNGNYKNFSLYQNFTLVAGDGAKELQARWLDGTSKSLAFMKGSTTLDTVAPVVDTVLLNSGAKYINIDNYSSNVTISMAAHDATSSVYQYRYIFQGASYTGWDSIVGAVTVPWAPSGDGDKTVIVRFRDMAGNESADTDPLATATINVNTQRPTGTAIAIVPAYTGSGIKYVKTTLVTVNLTKNGAVGLKLSNDGNFDFVDYRNVSTLDSLSWELTPGDATKTVYARFYNAAGNYTNSTISDSVVLDTTPPGAPNISITEAPLTNVLTVHTPVSATNASHYAIRTDTAFTDADWKTYPPGTTPTIDLTTGDGLKSVYAKFKDNLGNETQLVMATVQLDQTPPSNGSVKFAANPTSSLSQTLALFAIGATKMCLYGADITGACDPATASSTWGPYNTSTTITLQTGDNTKTVKVKFADDAGNKSSEYSDTTTLDTAPPVPDPTTPVLITGKAKDTNGADQDNTSVSYLSSVKVTLKAVGATRIAISNMSMPCNTATYTPASFDPVTHTYDVTSYLLQSGTGTKTVYACFKDDAGNFPTSPSSSTIYLDQSAPVNATFSINSGAAYALKKDVNLTTVSFTDDYNAQTYMQFSNCVDFAATGCGTTGWVNKAAGYPPSGTWTLSDPSGSDGPRTVYMKTRDYAGNEGQIVSASITLDQSVPTGASVTIVEKPTNGSSVDLILNASGATRMCIYGDINSPCDSATAVGTWPLYSTTKIVSLTTTSQGTKWVKVVFSDEAGNKAAEVKDSTEYDTSPPVPDGSTPVLLTGKAKNISGTDADNTSVTYLSDVKVTLKATGATKIALSNSSLTCSSATYVPVAFDGATNTYSLSGYLLQSGTGTKTVFACFKDDAGNYTTSPSSGTIYLDQTAPINTSFAINSGAIYTKTTAVTFDSITATDDYASQVYMMFSNCSTFAATGCDTTAWVNLASTYPSPGTWALLSGTDGLRKVYLKTRDFAGNESAVATAQITLDTAVPTSPSVTIVQKPYTNSTQVNLVLAASGAAKMCIYGDITTTCDPASAAASWQPYRTDMVVTLLASVVPPSATRTIYAVFSDDAGNKTAYSPTNIVKDSTSYDVTPPDNPTLQINSGDAYTEIQKVNLTMSAGGSPAQYWVEGDVDPTDTANAFTWKTYSTSGTVRLNGLQGSRQVRVKYKDAAGNESYPAFSSIIYDTTTPTGTSITATEHGLTQVTGYTRTRTVDLAITATEDLSGVAKMQISRCAAFTSPNIFTDTAHGDGGCLATDLCCTVQVPYAAVYLNYSVYSTAQGSKTIYVRFQNGAMALDPTVPAPWSASVNYPIYYDNADPALTSFAFKTLSTPAFTNSGIVDLSLKAADTGSGVQDVIFAENPPGYGNYSWETYAEDTPGNPMSKSFRLTSGEGLKTIKVMVRDKSGRTSADSGNTLAVTLDMTAPTLLSLSTAAYAKVASQVYNFSATDNYSAWTGLKVCHKVDTASSICPQICTIPGDWEAYPLSGQKTWSLPSPTEGQHTVYVCINDQAGNMTYNAGVAPVFFDVTKPNTPSLATPVAGSSSVTLSWSAVTDPGYPATGSGIDHYKVQYDPLGVFADCGGPGSPSCKEVVTTGTTTTMVVPNLLLHTLYSLRVLAYDKAGNVGDPSDVKTAVTGWQKTKLAPKPFYYATNSPGNYKPYYISGKLWIPAKGSDYTINVYHCDPGFVDCGDAANWSVLSLGGPSVGVVLQYEAMQMASAGGVIFLSAVEGLKPTIWSCNSMMYDCTNSADWQYMTLPNPGTPSPFMGYNIYLTLTSNGNMVAAMWANQPGSNTRGLNLSVCYTADADCLAVDGSRVAQNWSTPIIVPNADNDSITHQPFQPVAFADDKALWIFYLDNDAALSMTKCGVLTGYDHPGCTRTGDFNVGVEGSYGGGKWFRMDHLSGGGEATGYNISVSIESESRHVTWERLRKHTDDLQYYYERMVASCNNTNCGNKSAWVIGGEIENPATLNPDPAKQTPLLVSRYQLPTDMAMFGNQLRLVLRDPNEAKIYEMGCGTAMAFCDTYPGITSCPNSCGNTAKWTGKMPIDSGYTDGRPMISFWGPNPVMAIRDDTDFIRVFQPKIPGPPQFAVGPAVSATSTYSLSTSWLPVPSIGGYTQYYGTPDTNVADNKIAIPDPMISTSAVDLPDSQDYFSYIEPLKNGETGERTPTYEMKPFVSFTAPFPSTSYPSTYISMNGPGMGAVMCMDADPNRIAMALGTSTGGYLGYCNYDGTTMGASCAAGTNWTWVKYSTSTTIQSCKIALGTDGIAVSGKDGSNSTVWFCDGLATKCAISPWASYTPSTATSDAKPVIEYGTVAGVEHRIMTLMFTTSFPSRYHIAMCDMKVDDCTLAGKWVNTDIDTLYSSSGTSTVDEEYDIAKLYNYGYGDDYALVTSQTAANGIRSCYCYMNANPASCSAPGNWSCSWVVRKGGLRVYQLKLSMGNSGTYTPAVIYRENSTSRLYITYCTEQTAQCFSASGTGGGYWITVPIAEVSHPQNGSVSLDKYDISTFIGRYYATYMNRGTLYLAGASRGQNALFEGESWDKVPLLFNNTLFGSAHSGGMTKLVWFPSAGYGVVHTMYAYLDPTTSNIVAKVLLRGMMTRYK